MAAQAVAAGLEVPVARRATNEETPLSRARFAVELWRSRLADPRPPADWSGWLELFAEAERLVHGAARGMAREGFYDSTRAFLARTDAPQPVRDVVELRHALAAWDFAAAARIGAALLPSVTRRERLIPPDEYLDGVVTANLMVGNVETARAVFRTVAPLSGRADQDFRLRLLASYVEPASANAAEREPANQR
jgi:hypothetical protein